MRAPESQSPHAVGLRLLEARTAAQLELTDVARMMMMPVRIVGMLEQGRAVPTPDQATSFARIYSVSSAWLLKGIAKPALEPTKVIPLFGAGRSQRNEMGAT